MSLPSIFITPTRRARRFAERRNDIGAECQQRLTRELRDALFNEPMRIVQTPGFSAQPKMTAVHVFMDRFAGSKADERSYELVRLLADAANGHDVQMRALLMLTEASDEHGEWHATDALEQMERSL